MLARVKEQGIQVALANGGGLRASIDAGDVTQGEVLTVLPFQNTLATFQVDGATLKAALENGMGQFDDPEDDGRFPQVAGIKYVVESGNATGERVTEIMIDMNGTWEPLDLAKDYGVVSNNFVRSGGDGYKMFRTAKNVYDFGPDLADVTAEFLAAHAPYTPYLDGRITIK
jgi:5'-nucleotidase